MMSLLLGGSGGTPSPAAPQAPPMAPVPAAPVVAGCSGLEHCADSAESLRSLVRSLVHNASGDAMIIRLPEGANINLSGYALELRDGVALRIESSGFGAWLDAGQRSRVASVRDGASLSLVNVHLSNGRVEDESGGCILVEDGGTLRMEKSVLSCCEAVASRPIDAGFPEIRGGVAAADAHGGTIASLSSAVELIDTRIEGSLAVDGAAIFSLGGSLSLLRSTIRDSAALREGGAIALVSASNATLRGVSLDNNTAFLGGGALYLADASRLMLVDSFVTRCEAGTVGGALMLEGDATAVLRDSRVDLCSAATGGGAAVDASRLEMHNSSMTFNRASENGGGISIAGGGMGSVWLADSLIEDAVALKEGGGVFVEGGVLLLERSQILRCATHYGGGGMAVLAGGAAELRESTVVECAVHEIRGKGSALFVNFGASVVLRRTRIERCDSAMYGTVYVGGRLTLASSAIARCVAHDIGGSGSDYASRRGGVVWVVHGGVARLTDSTIDDCHTYDASPTGHSSMTLRARSRRLAAPPEPSFAPLSVDPHGTLSLANVLISNCTAQTGASAIFVSAEAHLRTAMLSLELPCLAGVPPAIHADQGADLSIRALSVSQPDNCRRAPAELAASAVSGAAATLGAGVSLVGGEQPGAGQAPASLCSAGTCATDAACTADYEAMADALMVTARCSCEPPNLPSPEAASAELAPYEEGCLTPREGVTVSVPQAVAENVVIEMSKTSRPETANRTIVLHMGGSSSAEARWTVDEGALPPWLTVWPTSGVLPAGVDKAAIFTVSATSAHVAEQSEPYTTAINLTVSSQRTKLFRVPVLVIVAVTTSAKHSMWGEARPTGEGSFECERADAPQPVELEVGEEREVVFTACDSEGLRVAHSLPSLRSEAVAAAGPKAFHVELHDREVLRAARPAEMLYAYVSLGRYKATVTSPLVGDLDLLLYVDGALVDSRHVVARCPPYLVPLPDRSCGCDTNLEPVGGLAESQGCRPCYMGYHKGAPGNGSCQPDTWPIIVSSVGGALGLVMILVLVLFARRIYQRHLLAMAAAEREGAEKRRRIQEAVKGVTSLKFPLSVMPLSKLREQGRLMPYEEARDAGALRCCDTMASAVSFAADHPLVFVSHQWLSASHPDPHSQHYPIILEAAEALCAEHGLDPSKLHLWLDYHSIPQANEATKWLAIGSIALYAACSHFFVVAAPHALHVDSSPPRRVDAETYLRRGWCRLEQWAFIAINGTQQMYVYETSLARIAERRRWIEESVNVFQGDFTLESDKAHLVDVVLGLYGLAVVAAIELRYRSFRATSVSSSGGEARVTAVGSCATRTSQEVSSRQLTELITERRNFIFPPEHFGDLVHRLEEELENAALERFGSEAGVRTPSPMRYAGHAASETFRAALTARRTLQHIFPPLVNCEAQPSSLSSTAGTRRWGSHTSYASSPGVELVGRPPSVLSPTTKVRASGDGPRRASHCAASQATRYAASPPRHVSFVDPPPPTGGRQSCGAAPPPVQVPPPRRRHSLGFAGLAGLPPLRGMSGKPQERRSSGTARQLAPMAPVSERRSLSHPSHARSQSGTGWRCPPATGGTVAEGDDRSSRISSTAMDVVTT